MAVITLRDSTTLLKRFALLCRLDRPADLAMLLLPIGWASLLAANGSPDAGYLISLILATILLRSAAWVFNDWMDAQQFPRGSGSHLARGKVTLRELQIVLAVLVAVSVLLLIPLPSVLLYYTLPVPLLIGGFPFLKTRTFLIQAYLGLCYAWLVPMAYASQGVHPDKAGWLLFTAVLLWSSTHHLLFSMTYRHFDLRMGIRSMSQLMGENSWAFIIAMQLLTVVSLWLTGKHLELGIFFGLGLIVMLMLAPYQLWLLFSHRTEGPARSYRSQIWSGIAVLCGISFHYLCACQT